MTMLVRELRLFMLALQFLTRVPVPVWVGFDPAQMRRAVRHFPLVGVLIGAFGACIALAANRFWPPTVAAALALAGTVWLTAAFHEDGLADTFDALLGAASREKALAIMTDSRIGTYGAVSLVLSLLVRTHLLAELMARDPAAAAAALIAAHASGRSAAVALMVVLPYARSDEGDAPQAKAGSVARDVPGIDGAWAVAIGLLALAFAARTQASPIAAGASLLMLVGMVFTLRRWLRRRLGGYTGDTLGASEQIGEMAILMVFAASGTG
ncbi:MAG: adenosylcobinamide-GDP ribazoletransferase [Piscinibacter sp.]|jgi:adenosylcobinamide-GDP ribazoletransferase|uniref:adenosylcobinamide-GDP ribazoletransferase n=1 Tax=Piscinibacter TaxID=1114981 RepID=UPI000FDE3A54|nr:adenosylcobinamide-GDP ribazoletransferase [Piscinibacter defluvii]